MLISIIIQQENLPDISAKKIVEYILPFNNINNIDISSFHIEHDYTNYKNNNNIINITQNTIHISPPSFPLQSDIILAISKNNKKIKTLKSRFISPNNLPTFDYYEIMLGYILENI